MKTTWPKHGGKTSIITSILHSKGLSTENIIDFSANINPLGIPSLMVKAMKKTIEIHSMTYPDLTYQEHREKIGNYEGVSFNKVLLTNGGAEAIYLSAAWLRGKKVAIFTPTFNEYERACQANGVTYSLIVYDEYFRACALPENIEEIIRQHDAIYVCRPNNPSGTCLSFEDMKALLIMAQRYHTYVLTDEAFIHFTNQEKSVVSLLERFDNLIIFRSLTKIYAVPGIRLGYVMAHESVISVFFKWQIPWSVNAVSLSLIDCLEECRPFVQETVAYIERERIWLYDEYRQLGLEMSQTCTNFYLLRDPSLQNHELLLLFLVEEGILARHTYNFQVIEGKALRFAIRTRSENERLVQSIKKWLQL